MQLNDYIRIVRRRWATIVVVTLVAVSCAAAYTITATKTYVASTQLFVSVQAADASSAVEAVQGTSAAQEKVRTYVGVIKSSTVLAPVIKKLHLDTTPAALADRVTATANSNTTLMDVAVTDTDPQRAAEIANAVGASFTTEVLDLESPLAGGSSLVKVRTIEPAVVPGYPSSPRVLFTLALGGLIGLAAGFSVAVLRSALDTRIHGSSDVEGITAVPILGGISFDPSIKNRPLIVRADPRSPRAEAFRALRTNLQFVDIGATKRCFVTTSSVPSEGKTTTTANLAIAIAESGATVVLVDGDLRRPRIAEIMGLEGAVGLTDILIGRVELEDALQPWGRGSLTVLPAGSIPPNPSELLGSAGMHALIRELTAAYDYVLVDAPPTLPVTDAALLSTVTSGALVVAAAGRTTKNQLQSALDNLERTGSHPAGVILTMLPAKGPNAYGYGSYDAYYGIDGKDPSLETDALISGRHR
ncbi:MULTISPECIES: polysaccharide biosynthesis tyrosine autokinase [unclassified Frondihabitans]|uniref:polysaccharide biosynthesis tyrosine autokinase n=1 Tax=unclassified Frondihabitans TaxID=2626248 RepID=UPI000F511593|nr:MULTISPECIES: polysaccharide biosynthesis tyrosine autokinase [unclassified Frondihabitans]RPE78207.1 capsular exopolysaccharide synthesis family protein [Frondihabitans sp. PhB153]RPF08488.1 capsular exopolysaccharide synthesis family protein [Frondihabitans sp. PhB161]